MRILIHPEELRRASAEVSRVAADLEGAASRADNALRRVPWEAREKAQIEQRAGELRKSSARLVQQAHEMGRSLQRTAERFDAADRAGLAGVGAANSGFQTAFQQWMTNPAAAYAALNATPAQQQLALGVLLAALLGGGGGRPGPSTRPRPGGGQWKGPDVGFAGGGQLWSKDYRHPNTPGEFRPSIGAGINGYAAKYEGQEHHGSIGGVDSKGQAQATFGSGQASAGLGMGKDGPEAYLGIGGAVLTTGAAGVVGSKNLGATGGVEAKFLSGSGQLGWNPDDRAVGAGIGVNLASVQGEAGANIAGVNAAVNGEIGLKAEIGFQFGQKTEIKLPLVTVGFSFGGAK